MKVKQKFLAPVYGLRKSLNKEIKLNNNLLLRNIDLLNKEYEFFEKHGLWGNYNVVLEINYRYDKNDASEPLPGISLNIINKLESALLVYGNGLTGVAGIFPDSKKSKRGEFIFYPYKTRFEDGLNKEINQKFVAYFKNFNKAYNMRPAAFDIYRKSRGRFANNDKTIDSCTVLESIFVPIGERAKKSFILNGINILGFKKNDIKVIDHLIDYRNAVIHADLTKQHRLLSGSKFTHTWFENAFELIREIIYKFVEAPWK